MAVAAAGRVPLRNVRRHLPAAVQHRQIAVVESCTAITRECGRIDRQRWPCRKEQLPERGQEQDHDRNDDSNRTTSSSEQYSEQPTSRHALSRGARAGLRGRSRDPISAGSSPIGPSTAPSHSHPPAGTSGPAGPWRRSAGAGPEWMPLLRSPKRSVTSSSLDPRASWRRVGACGVPWRARPGCPC